MASACKPRLSRRKSSPLPPPCIPQTPSFFPLPRRGFEKEQLTEETCSSTNNVLVRRPATFFRCRSKVAGDLEAGLPEPNRRPGIAELFLLRALLSSSLLLLPKRRDAKLAAVRDGPLGALRRPRVLSGLECAPISDGCRSRRWTLNLDTRRCRYRLVTRWRPETNDCGGYECEGDAETEGSGRELLCLAGRVRGVVQRFVHVSVPTLGSHKAATRCA